MKSLELRERLIKYLEIWGATVNTSNSFGLTNRNIGSEELYMNMLNIVHGHNLVEASNERVNFPAVDLIDKNRRLAVQVTSNSNLQSIKKRIDIFYSHGLDRDFEDFSFYIIGQRSKSIKDGDEYKGVPLDTNVRDTQMFIREVPSGKLQEVCEYFESEIFSLSGKAEMNKDVTNNMFANAVIHPGVTLNVSSGPQTVNVRPQNLSFDSHSQDLILHNFPSRSSLDSGLKGSLCNGVTKDKEQLHFVVSEISQKNLCDVASFEIDRLYDELDRLDGSYFDDLGSILWLLLYFENSSTKNPTLSLKKRAALKKQLLNFQVDKAYQKFLLSLELYNPQSINILNSIKFVEKKL